MKKKIVFLIDQLEIGGAQRYCLETAARIDRTSFEPKIYCLFAGGLLRKEAEERGVPVTVFERVASEAGHQKPRAFWRSRAFCSLFRYLWQEQPVLVHTYMYKSSIYGGIAAKMAGVPVLLTNRVSLGLFKDATPHYQWAENTINCWTDAVLVNSLAEKEDVLRREKLSPEKLFFVYNGVDTEAYQPNTSLTPELLKTRRELAIPDKAPVVGMLANLRDCKGYREFILAADEVRQVFPDVRFLCVGGDLGNQAQLEQLVHQLELRQHVLFPGQVKNAQEVLPLLDILVSASYEEGFSNTILEGMASGKPIVATAVGGTPEAIQHEQTGLLIPPKDEKALSQALIKLLQYPDMASWLGGNARKCAEEHFSMEQMIHKLESLYQTLLQRKGIL